MQKNAGGAKYIVSVRFIGASPEGVRGYKDLDGTVVEVEVTSYWLRNCTWVL